MRKAIDTSSDPDEKIDADTILSNANAAAIHAGNVALMSWVNSSSKLNLSTLHEYGETAAMDFQHMVEGIALLTKSATPLTDESFARYKSIIDRFDGARLRYVAAAQRVASLLHAYEAGGAEGLANKNELGVFETIQEWKSKNDPKAKALRFALDQDSKSVRFDEVTIDAEAPMLGASVTNYYCYPFHEETYRSEDATLYVSNGAAAAELMKLGLAPANTGTVGDAEKAEDKPGSGLKLTISASIAKAIESLGIPGTANQARVTFYLNAGPLGAITNKDRGAWFEDWRSTSEFASFWRTHLGGKYAYLMSPAGKRQTIPAAAADPEVMQRSTVFVPITEGTL